VTLARIEMGERSIPKALQPGERVHNNTNTPRNE
jgi:hypothetical protein